MVQKVPSQQNMYVTHLQEIWVSIPSQRQYWVGLVFDILLWEGRASPTLLG
mgnify:CR=1 FL=1